MGHIISADGLAVEPYKVKAIEDWPVCASVEEVRGFLGLAGFYRRFVKDFSKKALPLTELTKKKAEWRWRSEQQAAFDSLKKSVSEAPVLVTPDSSLPYTVSTDASGYAIGAVLQQDHGQGLQPVAYMSKKLLPAEARYTVGEQEMLAIVTAMKTWRHYLHGSECVILTDNHALQYLDTQKELSARQARWTEVMAQFRYTIRYKPGKDNKVADALSRRADHQAGDEWSQQRHREEERKRQLEVWQVPRSEPRLTRPGPRPTATTRQVQTVAGVTVLSVTDIQNRIRTAMADDREREKRGVLDLLQTRGKQKQQGTVRSGERNSSLMVGV